MAPRAVLITGANRGIGLEFVRQFATSPTPPQRIFATCRDPSKATELQKLAKKHAGIHIIPLDLSDDKSIHSAYSRVLEIDNYGLNLLINNAGIAQRKGNVYPEIDREAMRKHFEANVYGAILMTQTFAPLLKKAVDHQKAVNMCADKACIFNISSGSGSIAKASVDGYKIAGLGYKMSKTALNMAVKCLATEMNALGVLCVAVCPGWVRTDMGTQKAQLSPAESVSAMMKSIDLLAEKHQGGFFHRDLKKFEY